MRLADLPHPRQPEIRIDGTTDPLLLRALLAEAVTQDVAGRFTLAQVRNLRELFLVERHADAVGRAALNLVLSDRRAESVALALAEYLDVPPENMIVQGYGERFPRIKTAAAEPRTRRVTVRRVTELLQ